MTTDGSTALYDAITRFSRGVDQKDADRSDPSYRLSDVGSMS